MSEGFGRAYGTFSGLNVTTRDRRAQCCFLLGNGPVKVSQ